MWDLKNCEVKRNEVKLLSRVRLFVTLWTVVPGSSVHGIFQAGVLEWVAIYFSRGAFQLRDLTRVPTMQADALPI